MQLKALWRRSRVRKHWLRMPLHKNYLRLKRLLKTCGAAGLRYLLPWHLYLDWVEISVTTRCNFQCPGCALLMPQYRRPCDADAGTVIASIRKLSECVDVFGQFRLLGGEPFLNPDLKRFIAEIPSEKCLRVTIPTNATIVPDDAELYALLRQKRVTLVLGNYPAAAQTQAALIARLEREGVAYMAPKGAWIDYGRPVDYGRDPQALRAQFLRCGLFYKSVLNGKLYYCSRQAHGHDLGLYGCPEGEAVDLLHNSKAQNRRQLRRLMWRTRPVEGCRYCQRGTKAAARLPRGK